MYAINFTTKCSVMLLFSFHLKPGQLVDWSKWWSCVASTETSPQVPVAAPDLGMCFTLGM